MLAVLKTDLEAYNRRNTLSKRYRKNKGSQAARDKVAQKEAALDVL